MAVGGVCLAYGGPSTKAAGAGLLVDGGAKFIKATAEYIWPQENKRDGSRENDRERDRPSMADRDMDRGIDRSR